MKICSVFKIDYKKEMLSWNKGPHPQDGIWGKYWYDTLWKSTTFSLYKENNSIQIISKFNFDEVLFGLTKQI